MPALFTAMCRAAVLGDDVSDERGDLGVVRDVGDVPGDAARRAGGGRLGKCGAVAAGNDDGGSLGSECERGCPADARATAGHQGHATREARTHFPIIADGETRPAAGI
jgi:hypothetical protein